VARERQEWRGNSKSGEGTARAARERQGSGKGAIKVARERQGWRGNGKSGEGAARVARERKSEKLQDFLPYQALLRKK